MRQGLLRRLEALASREPPADARLFSVRGLACGILMPRSYEILCSPAFYDVFESTKDGLDLAVDAHEVTPRLAKLAEELHRAEAFFQWRAEALDVITLDQHTIIGKAERGLFRFLGLTTTCVHAVATDRHGRFWIGKRSSTKQVDPDLWDTISGGLANAGETPEETLARETYEEAGLTPEQYTVASPFEFLVTRPVREGWMRERTLVYPITLRDAAFPHNLDGEVSAFEAVEKAALCELIAQDLLTLDAAIAFLKAFQIDTAL